MRDLGEKLGVSRCEKQERNGGRVPRLRNQAPKSGVGVRSHLVGQEWLTLYGEESSRCLGLRHHFLGSQIIPWGCTEYIMIIGCAQKLLRLCHGVNEGVEHRHRHLHAHLCFYGTVQRLKMGQLSFDLQRDQITGVQTRGHLRLSWGQVIKDGSTLIKWGWSMYNRVVIASRLIWLIGAIRAMCYINVCD